MYTLQVLSSSLGRFKQFIPTIRIQLNDITEDFKPYRESEIRVTWPVHTVISLLTTSPTET